MVSCLRSDLPIAPTLILIASLNRAFSTKGNGYYHWLGYLERPIQIIVSG